MGKKRISVIGSEEEDVLKVKKAVKLEQKKLREGLPAGRQGKKTVKAPGLEESQMEEVQKQPASVAETETKKPRVSRPRSRPYQQAKKQVDAEKVYPLTEALPLLRKITLTKFDPTVELHLNVAEKGLSFPVTLPHPTAKTTRYALADEATLAKIAANKIDFDVLVASPAQMTQLTKFAKTLGPRGLMPNPKNGTLAADPEAAIAQMKTSTVSTLKTEKDAPLIHTVVGKLSQSDQILQANIIAILTAVKPITKAVLKSTMSPAIKIQM